MVAVDVDVDVDATTTSTSTSTSQRRRRGGQAQCTDASTAVRRPAPTIDHNSSRRVRKYFKITVARSRVQLVSLAQRFHALHFGKLAC